jgi:pyruvate/2-oxoglutarate dehydrogenase complex dihydrolipoamide dehydrogenase (E3) component
MKVIIVGGGFIGLEVAENLLSAGLKATLLEFADHVMPPLDADIVVMGVGVTPDTQLAKDAGLKLGLRGPIVVDKHLRTSAPHVWAVGDATGLSEKAATQAGISHDSVILHPASHAGYYPGAAPMEMKIVFFPEGGRILGAQIVGKEGVDKRIDVLAAAISAHMAADDLAQLDLAYAPPYSSAKDPVNMAGYVIGNVLAGREKIFHAADVDKLPCDGSVFLLDCRTSAEYARSHMEGFVNIAVDDLREHLDEIPETGLCMSPAKWDCEAI